MVASGSAPITRAIVGNAYFLEKIRDIIDSDRPGGVLPATRREALMIIQKVVNHYHIDMSHVLVFRYNILARLVGHLTEEHQSSLSIN